MKNLNMNDVTKNNVTINDVPNTTLFYVYI